MYIFNKGIKSKFVEGDKSLATVVLVHGDLQNLSSMENLSSFYRDKGHSVLSADLPGHGHSELNSQGMDFNGFVYDLLDFHEVDKPIFVGHSFGGMVCVDYINQTEDFSGLVLINSFVGNVREAIPSLDLDKEVENYIEISRSKFKRREFIDYSSIGGLSEEGILDLGFRTTPPESFTNNLMLHKRIREPKKLYDTDSPIVLAACDKDRFVSLEYLTDIGSRMKNAQVFKLSSTHNRVILERESIFPFLEESYRFLVGQ